MNKESRLPTAKEPMKGEVVIVGMEIHPMATWERQKNGSWQSTHWLGKGDQPFKTWGELALSLKDRGIPWRLTTRKAIDNARKEVGEKVHKIGDPDVNQKGARK